MKNPDTARLEVAHMRESILHAFSQHQEDIRSHLAEELQRAADEFDYANEVRHAIREILPGLVKREIGNVVTQVLSEHETHSEFERVARRAVSDYLTKSS